MDSSLASAAIGSSLYIVLLAAKALEARHSSGKYNSFAFIVWCTPSPAAAYNKFQTLTCVLYEPALVAAGVTLYALSGRWLTDDPSDRFSTALTRFWLAVGTH